MSSGPETRATVEGCNEAVKKIKTCCPAHDSYLSCTYTSSSIFGRIDISTGQSRCLMGKSCEEIEKAVTGNRSLCRLSFGTTRCRD
jgi:hypothetical protein